MPHVQVRRARVEAHLEAERAAAVQQLDELGLDDDLGDPSAEEPVSLRFVPRQTVSANGVVPCASDPDAAPSASRMARVPATSLRTCSCSALHGVEPLLGPQPANELQADLAAVEVAFEVEDERLHGAPAVVEGGADADARSRHAALALDVRPGRVDAVAGDGHPGRELQVRGRKPERPAAAVTRHDLPAQRVVPTQQLRRGRDVAFGQGVADVSAPDRPARRRPAAARPRAARTRSRRRGPRVPRRRPPCCVPSQSRAPRPRSLIPMRLRSRTANSRAVNRDSPTSKDIGISRSTPSARMRRSRSSSVVRYRGSKSGLSTDAGWFFNVRTMDVLPVRRATSLRRPRRCRWPRCTPSNTPMVTAASRLCLGCASWLSSFMYGHHYGPVLRNGGAQGSSANGGACAAACGC